MEDGGGKKEKNLIYMLVEGRDQARGAGASAGECHLGYDPLY